MSTILRRFRGPLIALVALIFSAGIAFAGQPASPGAAGLAKAATHAGKTVPVQATDEESEQDEDTDAEGTEDSESADNCTTDPTTLTEDELAAARHGSVVCWAAHQTDWPDWFSNHGAFVSCWAHQGKEGAPSCTEAPTEELAATTHGNSHSNGHAKGPKPKDH